MARRLMLVALLLAMMALARADALMVDVYTWHPSSQPWMQNNTPGLQYVADNGVTLGAFCNSYSASQLKPERDSAGRSLGRKNCEQTYDLGWTVELAGPLRYGLFMGGAVGYHRGVVIGGAHVMPIIAPFLRAGPIKLMWLAPDTYHLALQFEL